MRISRILFKPLLFAGAPVAAPIGVIQMIHLIKDNLRLILHDPELTDSVIHLNLRVTHGIHRHEPLIVIAAVGGIYHALMICLNDSEIFKGGTPWHHMGLIALGQFHSNSQRNQFKLSRFQADILRGTQIDPIGFTVNISQFLYFVRKIFDLDGFHSLFLFLTLRIIAAVKYGIGGIRLFQTCLYINDPLVTASLPQKLCIL